MQLSCQLTLFSCITLFINGLNFLTVLFAVKNYWNFSNNIGKIGTYLSRNISIFPMSLLKGVGNRVLLQVENIPFLVPPNPLLRFFSSLLSFPSP